MKFQRLGEEKLTETNCHNPVFAGLIELVLAVGGEKGKL